jgi:FMN phosphatase YigB (HAD superfamily)
MPVDRGQFLADFAGWPTALYAGAADLVARIPPTYVRATLSNTNVLHWPRLAGELGLDALFDRHFPSDVTGKLKPDREVFAHVADESALIERGVLAAARR